MFGGRNLKARRSSTDTQHVHSKEICERNLLHSKPANKKDLRKCRSQTCGPMTIWTLWTKALTGDSACCNSLSTQGSDDDGCDGNDAPECYLSLNLHVWVFASHHSLDQLLFTITEVRNNENQSQKGCFGADFQSMRWRSYT